MRRDALVLTIMASCLGLVVLSAAAQEEGQQEDPQEAGQQHDGGMAFVFLDATEGGADGYAVLRAGPEGAQETHITVAMRNGDGALFGLIGFDEDEVGPAVIMGGTCGLLGDLVDQIWQTVPMYAADDQDEVIGYVASGTVPVEMDTLLTASYVIGVSEAEDQTGMQSVPVQELQEIELLSCGNITEGARLQPGE